MSAAAEGPRCTGCGAPLTSGGWLCIQCGKQNMPSKGTGAVGPPAPAPPAVPWLGFRHPRDGGSTWLVVIAILAALFIVGGILAFLLYL